jgi:glycine dehydrogenase
LSKNKLNRTYIGEGFYGTLIPHVIERNFLSNPGWYTAYTPYQAEISQGRLAGLMCYQEICRTLTGFEIAGASLLDEASAASESMIMSFHNAGGKLTKYYVDEHVFPNSIKVIKTNAKYLGIEVIVKDATKLTEAEAKESFGVLFQNPDNLGRVKDLTGPISAIKAANKKSTVSVGTDLASLLLHKTPASMGADVAYGNSQRFGVPLGFGGPAAAFFATHASNIRKIPGRIIGQSIDSQGNPAFRMAL